MKSGREKETTATSLEPLTLFFPDVRMGWWQSFIYSNTWRWCDRFKYLKSQLKAMERLWSTQHWQFYSYHGASYYSTQGPSPWISNTSTQLLVGRAGSMTAKTQILMKPNRAADGGRLPRHTTTRPRNERGSFASFAHASCCGNDVTHPSRLAPVAKSITSSQTWTRRA